MKSLRILTAAAVVLFAGSLVAAEAVKSGPQVNEKVPGPFHPLNINGDKAGEKNCLFCQHGENPVAMIFARNTSPELTRLIKEIDAATMKNKDAQMGSFVVFLSDNEGLEKQLKDMVKNEKIQSCVLSIDNPAGPKDYNISKDADVTVVLYKDRTVKANHSFKKGEMKDADIQSVIKDIQKITK